MSSVFEQGKIVKSYPFLLRYLPVDLKTDICFQIVISVPKRRFKKAVDRNRIKRLIREAIRKNKYILEEAENKDSPQLALFLIYTSNQEETYHKMMHKIEKLFQRLVDDKG